MNMKQWYSGSGLWALFLACVFPVHLWTLILGMNDFQWISERTNSWDAVGVMAYGLAFALFESLVVWAAAVLAGFLISTKWDVARRVAVMGTLVFVLAGWAMYEQAHFVWGLQLPQSIVALAQSTGHPVRIMLAFYLIPVGLSVLAPTYFLLRGAQLLQFTRAAFERLAILSGFYLLLDLVSIAIIVSRNV
jgi:hypothetical protein